MRCCVCGERIDIPEYSVDGECFYCLQQKMAITEEEDFFSDVPEQKLEFVYSDGECVPIQHLFLNMYLTRRTVLDVLGLDSASGLDAEFFEVASHFG